MAKPTATQEIPPPRVHISVVEALTATVYPPWAAPYPSWVRLPRSEAEFIASLVVHFRDQELPERFKGKPFAPICDLDGYVTALPLRIKGGAR